ncbi:MAG: hypothetical protein J0H74_12655 [Chitinophagaceae bacterium]|nr:hypothetical protein [Chitinophagaceae bacterium]
MFKSGNSFADYLFITVTFLPLLPAMFIIFQKNFGKGPLDILLIICLVNFIRDLPIHLHMLNSEGQNVLDNVCYPIELILLARLFRTTLTKPCREILTITLVAFLSSLLTWLSIKGWENNAPGLEIIQNSMLIGVILLSLPFLVQAKGLNIFRSSLFWIAGGTLFYIIILLLLKWADPGGRLNAENKVLLSLAAIIRYCLYMLAALPGRDEVPAE